MASTQKGDGSKAGREDHAPSRGQTPQSSSRCSPEMAVISRVPQYPKTALVSGVHTPPSQLREIPLNPADDPADDPATGAPITDTTNIRSHRHGTEISEVFANFLSIDQEVCGTGENNEEDDAGPSSKDHPNSQEYLLKIKQQAGSQLRAQKEHHIKELHLRKDRLQQLLLKLDTMKGSSGRDPSRKYSREREGPLGEGVSGEEDRATVGPGDRQREGADERTLTDNMADGPVQLHMFPHHSQTASTLDRDECDRIMHRSNEAMHLCWRRIFQSASFPFSLAAACVIELVTFITQFIIKVLVVGVVVVLGEQVITPLTEALFSHALQPVARCLLNVLLAVKDVLRPLLAVVREVFLHIALLVQSFRLVDVNMAAAQPHARQVM